ncbi:copper resistance CopC family protein [Arthrobacter sp. Helios]|uniref:copper resistance CopC family protein n=1 Tax=Arthrobacter sp. Helios TaxID=2828862 RepID=UPI00206EEDD9|nr:copper resistance CopC family protein [Arthrobacter sp. Helios]UPO75953.1 copper resistance protein CopC [Arthrobacter sp. Helios]
MTTSLFQHARARAVLLAAALFGALALFLVAAPPALAHDELVSSTPEDGTVLAEAPTEIELVFSAELMDLGNQVVLADASGANLIESEPVLNRETLAQPLPALEDGEYQVTWRAVSSDGHPITGAFSFTVGAPVSSAAATDPAAAGTATPTATESAPEESATAIAPGETSSSVTFGPLGWVLTALGGALVGVIIYVIVVAVNKRRRGGNA